MERTELTVRSMIFSPLLLLWQGQHLYVSDWISSVVSPVACTMALTVTFTSA